MWDAFNQGTGAYGGRSVSIVSDSVYGNFLQSLDLRSGRSNTRRGRGVYGSAAASPYSGLHESSALGPGYASSHMAPCVPFIAMGVITPLIHLEVRHQDTIKTTTSSGETRTLINFAKHRRISEIVEGFMGHQRTPYTFVPDPQIQVY